MEPDFTFPYLCRRNGFRRYVDVSYNIVYLNALGISYTANSEDANDKGFSFMTVAGILVGSLILLAAGLVIYNILKISVSKRIKGYGTLRAIGSEKGQLYQIIVIEVTLLCLIGIPIGMLLGFLSARGILEAATGLVSPELFLVQDSSELKTLIAENSSLNGTLLILSGAITLAFALFAALPAARSAARVSPIMAMSGTNLKIRRRKRKTKKIHNFEAYYARLNLKRNKGRTAITILSLVMSITVFIALQGFSSLLNAASALQDNHLGDYQITNESVGFTADDLNTLQKNEAVQSVAAIQFSLYEQNENGQLNGISLEFQLKPGETFQVVGLNDEYWDYFMGDQLSEEQLGQLKSGNACIVRNPIPMGYGEDVLEFTNIEAGESICVAGTELDVLKTLDGYDGYLGIGNGGFTNGVQVIVDDAIYERLTGKDTYSEFLPTLNEGADRENFDTFIEAFCNRTPGTTFLSYEETDQQLKESFAQIQMLAWGLILFVGLIGILNIINTVYTNIHTRVTEIGMQRAIGMSTGIENVASLDALLSSISQERINRELAQEYAAQIRVNEKRVAQTEGFKAKLYENLVSGILTKEEFLSYKRKYNADIELFQKAIAEWNDKLTDVLENRSERNRWINHFMKFSTMEDIDRRVVMQLIRSIRVMGKDELHIEFNYQDEYQKAISLAEQIATKNEERMVG